MSAAAPQTTSFAAPVLTLLQPVPGSLIATRTPPFAFSYTDPAGSAGEPVTGVSTGTLTVTVDGTDRTSLFVKTSTGASATFIESAWAMPAVSTPLSSNQLANFFI